MRNRMVLLPILALFLLGGCAFPASTPLNTAAASPAPDSRQRSESEASGQFGGFSFGDDAAWPDYLPEDIPPIPATITTVMAGEDQIRLFFSGLPEDGFTAYLQLLERQGFTLRYVVYAQEGMPEDKARERLDRGEFDAVNATKGTYILRIEYANGQGTFDIDPRGLPEGTAIRRGPEWPEALQGVLDAPENCEIQAVSPAAGEATAIHVKSESTSLLEDYMAQLCRQGFQERERSNDQNGDIIDVTYTKDRVRVTLRSYQPGEMGVTVRTDADTGPVFGKSANGRWPEGLPASLPEFEGRQILSSLVTGAGTVKIMIGLQDASDPETYRNLLMKSGFTAEGAGDAVFQSADCRVKVEEFPCADFFTITVEIL